MLSPRSKPCGPGSRRAVPIDGPPFDSRLSAAQGCRKACPSREDSERHQQYRTWLEQALNGAEQVALFEPVLASVIRVGTAPIE